MSDMVKERGTTEDKLADAKRQGQAQFDSILEMVEALQDPSWKAAEITDEQVRAVMHFGPIAGEEVLQNEREITEQDRADVAAEFNSTESQWDERRDNARQAIEDDALSVEVRGGWLMPGTEVNNDTYKPTEYRILLCTGGPACQIVGELNEHCEPIGARMQVQDWFHPWTDFRPIADKAEYAKDKFSGYDSEQTLLDYARCFWFGE